MKKFQRYFKKFHENPFARQSATTLKATAATAAWLSHCNEIVTVNDVNTAATLLAINVRQLPATFVDVAAIVQAL